MSGMMLISEFSSRGFKMYPSGGSLDDIRKKLKAAGLIENIDFAQSKDQSYRAGEGPLVVSGASKTIKALLLIPQDMINTSFYRRTDGREDLYIIKGCKFVTEITAEQCLSSDLPYIHQAGAILFQALRTAVYEKIHRKYPSSSVINQLNADLRYIENIKDEKVFETPKYLLAYSSIFYAVCSENKQKTTRSSFLFYKGKSVLAPEYKHLLEVFKRDFAPNFTSLSPEKLLEIYNQHVQPRQSTEPLAIPAAVNPAVHPVTTILNATEVSIAHLTPVKPTVVVESQSDSELTRRLLTPLVESLRKRRVDIQRRILRKQWCQSMLKNNAKISAIDAIVEGFDAGKTAQELIDFIRLHRNDLVQSTSTLPHFFRAKVTTEIILQPYDHMLSPQS